MAGVCGYVQTNGAMPANQITCSKCWGKGSKRQTKRPPIEAVANEIYQKDPMHPNSQVLDPVRGIDQRRGKAESSATITTGQTGIGIN